MAGQDVPHDPNKALECKEKGNKCFQAGDYVGAEALYSKAINYDPTNPLLYTNRAMALLKLSPPSSSQAQISLPSSDTSTYERVISDSLSSIRLLPENMKAYYYLAQAQIALHRPEDALRSSKRAHELCVEEIYGARGGKGASSVGPITELVLRCKKEAWEEREEERVRRRGGLLMELVEGLVGRRREEVEMVRGRNGGLVGSEEERRVERGYENKIEELKSTFEIAGINGGESARRKVPDWCVDDITFSVMLDPVVTRTGQSYDRSSIMEHLRRSQTDPLTREPLRMEDLRPNLALKAACEEFLQENGWAVDW